MKKVILKCSNIEKSYLIDKTKIEILKNISFEIYNGEFICIMGSSGCGKSTLLSILAGLDNCDSGKIVFDNEDITNLKEDGMSKIRNEKIGFIFQSFHLIPSLNVLENVMFPLEIRGKSKTNERLATDLIKKVGLYHRINSYPNNLSGGEKQRVSIARALINNPKIIFADEPTGNLDEKNSKEILELLKDIQKKFKTTLIIVTHEKEISKKADRVLMLKNGKLNL